MRHKRFGRIAAAVVLASCVDSPVGPGDQAPATVTVRVTLPAATPAAWSPIGETVYLAVRRAGRVEPIADTTFVVLDSLGATFDVPLAYAVERFVVSAEVRYDGLVLFLGFEALQLRAAGDTALTLPTIYVGPGARAASFVLGVSDSTLSSLDTASLIRVVRDSAGQVIPNVPARFVTARPTLIAVDTAGLLTARPGTLDTARVTGFLPMGLVSTVLMRVVGNPVATVVVTPPADTIVAVGATAQFGAVAFDALGAPVGGTTFVWASANAGVALVSASGLVTATGAGTASITATADGISGTATIVVALGGGAPGNKRWIGGAAGGPNDWARAGNWDPAGAPGAADTVWIESTANDPVLSGPVTVAQLFIQGGNLTINGQPLTVTGRFRTNNDAGTLTMDQPDDTVRILGSAVFEGGSTIGRLTDGVFYVMGDFEQHEPASEAFRASGNHRTVFNGPVQQRFRPEGLATFGHLEIANTGGVRGELEQTVEIERTMRISTAVAVDGFDIALDIGDSLLTVTGSRLTTARVRLTGAMVVAGTFDPPTVEFAGAGQSIQPGLGYQNVEVTGSARLTGPTTFSGYLLIKDGGTLTLNGRSLSAAALNVGVGTNSGALIMQNPSDALTVAGNATFDGDTTPGLLAAGTLQVGEDLLVPRGRFRAEGTHRTVLNGTGQQFLRLRSGVRFQHLEVVKSAGSIEIPVSPFDETLEFTVGGKFGVRTAVALSAPEVLMDVGDSVVTVPASTVTLYSLTMRRGIGISGALTANTVEFAGVDQDVPPAIAYANVTVSGQARLVATTTFGGFTLVRGPAANLTLSGHRLTVGGTLSVGGAGIPEGTVTMTNPADSLIALSDASFAGAASTGRLTAGTVIVGGGFFTGEDPAAYQPTGTHRTVLNGAGQQVVYFDRPGTASSHFNDLELANTSAFGVFLTSPVVVTGSLRVAGPAQVMSGNSHHLLTVGGAEVSRLTLDTIPIAIGAGAITRFDSVTFARQNRSLAQLTIAHPGAATAFAFTGTRFLSAPTTGSYVNATDAAPSDGNPLTINMTSGTPANGSAQTVTAGGAVVNWVVPALVFASISSSPYHSCAVTVAGAAYCWGPNFSGNIGDGTTINRTRPSAVTGGLSFSAIAAGIDGTCALTTGGTPYCWGTNVDGALGFGPSLSRSEPVPVAGGYTFVSIVAGVYRACGLAASGQAYCWGRNQPGSLGDGTVTPSFTPVAVSGGLSFTMIATGAASDHTCGLTAAGAAYCWGANNFGSLGDGTTIQRTAPVAVTGGVAFVKIAVGGNQSCGLTATGAAFCWGFNQFGQLGDGTTIGRSAPVAVSGGYAFAALSVGSSHTCGVTAAGLAYCWGLNNTGAIGDGSTSTPRLQPTAVLTGLSFTAISVGSTYSCAIAVGGAAYCWGENYYGLLGDGTLVDRLTPNPVGPPLP